MDIKLICFILVLFFVTAASASFSSYNGKIGMEQIMSNDLAKDMSIKVDPFLAAWIREKPYENIPVLIELKEQHKVPFDTSKAKSLAVESQSALAASLESIQAENVEQHWIVNVISAKVAAQSIDDIAARPDVEKVWLDREVKLIEPVSALSATDYGDEQIGAPQVWDIGYNGTGIKIAILDTGINDMHPDLDEGKVVAAKDFTDDQTTDDLHGHGTHCAGIAAGERNTGTNIAGVAPGASLINAKVMNQSGFGYNSWIISGIEWSMDQDADILSMSLGGWQQDGTGRDPLDLAVTNAVDAGYVVVIAAGNEGPGEGTIASPAVAYGAIAVAASDLSDGIAGFSSRGPTGDGRSGIDVAAPGVGINSTNAGWEIGDDYAVMSGTSMACPHVAGAAALLLEAYPDLTPDEVGGALMNAADDIGYEILDQGAGRLNVTTAYHALTNGTLVNDPQWFVGRVHQENLTKTFTVYNNNDTTITVNITCSSGDAGDWITPGTPSLSVLANDAATFDATMNVTTTVPGAYSGSITVSGGSSDITIPVSVNVMQMVNSATIDHIEGNVDEDSDWVYYTLDVQAGITNLNLSLNWTDTNNDLDLILFNPNGELTEESARFDVPEVISVDNPSTGNWTVAINAWDLTIPGTYNLMINATGENIGEIIGFTVTPEDVERYDKLTFEVNFTNTGTGSITANGILDICHIGEYGSVWEDELILSSKSANAGGSMNWIMEWTASMMPGNYEATARLYYDKTVTEKTEPFNITDTTPPAVTAMRPLEMWVNNGTVLHLNATITDIGSGVRNATVNVSGVNETITTAVLLHTAGDYWRNDSIMVDTTNSGLQNLTIMAYDNAGNMNDIINLTVKVDNAPPVVIILSPTGGEVIQNSTFDLNITINEISDIWYCIGSDVNSTEMRRASLNATLQLNDGHYNLTAFACDLAGNVNSTQLNFTVFAAPPAVDVPEAGEIFYLPHKTTFVNGTTATGTNVTVYVNGVNESYAVSDGMFNISGVPVVNGTNEINVRAIYNDSTNVYFSANTTVVVSVGGIFNVTEDKIKIYVPGLSSEIFPPVIDFNITGQPTNRPDKISTAVVVAALAQTGSNITGPAIDFSVPGNESYTFNKPISLTLGFDPTLAVNINKTVVAWYDDSGNVWVSVKSSVNTTTNTTTANITHFTVFAPLEDDTPPANITGLEATPGTDSITLSWVNSPDTEYVEIWRMGVLITNVSSIFYTDCGLSSGTSYNYGLRPVDIVGNKGNRSNITTQTSTSTSSPPSSNGGGGGGGTTGEPYANIGFKDAARVYISRDAQISFTFDEPENDIRYVRYRALTSAGYISTIIEVLKDTSTFAKQAAPEIIYKNINIWVGKSGYATERNMENPVVGFKVGKKWIEDNSIDVNSIKLNRYDEDTWTALPTAKTDEDSTYLYFESQIPGFSPFAITGHEKTPAAQTSVTLPEEPSEVITPAPEVEAPQEPSGWKYFLPGAVILLIIAGAYLYLQKQQN